MTVDLVLQCQGQDGTKKRSMGWKDSLVTKMIKELPQEKSGRDCVVLPVWIHAGFFEIGVLEKA